MANWHIIVWIWTFLSQYMLCQCSFKLSDHLFVYCFCSITSCLLHILQLLQRFMVYQSLYSYTNLPFQAWVLYRESNWLSAIIWIILLVCFGRYVSCPLLNLLKSICCLEKSYDFSVHIICEARSTRLIIFKNYFAMFFSWFFCFIDLFFLLSSSAIYPSIFSPKCTIKISSLLFSWSSF